MVYLKKRPCAFALAFLPIEKHRTCHAGFGKHAPDPTKRGRCMCFRIYGQQKLCGCYWYIRWLDNIQKAVKLGQRLKVAFFAGQVGKGKVSLADIPHSNLSDGVGLGGSQKGEVATLDELGYEYDQVDVTTLLEDLFLKKVVDAWHAPDAISGCWRRGTVVKLVTRNCPDGSDEMMVHWKIRCSMTGTSFLSLHLRDPALAMQRLCSHIGGSLRKLL